MTAHSYGPIITLTGPTAVGKTALSLELAAILDAEIVSVDSRQLYKELNIGTAKPDQAELAAVRHHLISERSIGEPVSAGQYAELAEGRIDTLVKAGVSPLLVGGSTLYLHALQHGLSNIPPIPNSIRDELNTRLSEQGTSQLYQELTKLDPHAAATMDPTKSQRILRALEVYYGTGKPLSSFHHDQPPPRYTYITFVLSRDRDHLYQRIEQRVNLMLEEGLVEEVEQLMNTGFDTALPVFRTIGYQEVIAHLQGDYPYDEMVRLIKRNTRRYAKRQLTWFRRFDEYHWIDLDTTDTPPLDLILESTNTRSC